MLNLRNVLCPNIYGGDTSFEWILVEKTLTVMYILWMNTLCWIQYMNMCCVRLRSL